MNIDIRISDLKHRVRLEQPVRVDDGGGGGTVTWALVAEFWAAVVATSGRERSVSDALIADVNHTIYCRYREDIGPTHRLVLGARVFEIRSVLNLDDNKQFLKLGCEEVVA